MADFIEPGPICDTAGIREAVCIHTRKIFDSCRDKDIASIMNLQLADEKPRQEWVFLRKSTVAQHTTTENKISIRNVDIN